MKITERSLTCIVCPMGCSLSARILENGTVEVTGNACARGAVYAEKECTHPERTVTTTVRCTDGGLVSVKTAKPIPKEKVMECMAILSKTVAELPLALGDVILSDVCGSPVVATENRK